MEIIDKTSSLLKSVKDFLSNSPWKFDFLADINDRLNNLWQPCELAVVGRVKAGKSSFINALLGVDYAVVNATEATATINVFRYGVPKDDLHPVKVVWADGKEKWQTREFLDSLQGNSDEVLNRAKNIDHLEYYLNNTILQNITLVDTPGTGSVVAEHNNRLANYLAQQNLDRSNNLQRKADAVIVLVGHVQRRGDEDTVKEFTDASNPFNFIGVMSKIDTECTGSDFSTLDEEYKSWQKRCRVYSEKLRDRLHSIHPVSVRLYQVVEDLTKNGRITTIQNLLRKLPEDYFEYLLESADHFAKPIPDPDLENEYENFGLSVSIRKEMIQGIEFTVFKVIAKELYDQPIEVAVGNLRRFSGIDNLKEVLDKQFFSRSRIMRCHAALINVHKVLREILDYRIPLMGRTSPYKSDLLKVVNNMSIKVSNSDSDNAELKKMLYDLVENYIWTDKELTTKKAVARQLILETEHLLELIIDPSTKSEGLLLLEQNASLISADEFSELENVFGKNGEWYIGMSLEVICNLKEQWREKVDYCSNSNEDKIRKRIMELAVNTYDRIIDKIYEEQQNN